MTPHDGEYVVTFLWWRDPDVGHGYCWRVTDDHPQETFRAGGYARTRLGLRWIRHRTLRAALTFNRTPLVAELDTRAIRVRSLERSIAWTDAILADMQAGDRYETRLPIAPWPQPMQQPPARTTGRDDEATGAHASPMET